MKLSSSFSENKKSSLADALTATFSSKRKEDKLKAEELDRTGIVLQEITPSYGVTPKELKRYRAFICFIRGILIFFASYGTVGALVSAFGLSYYYLPVIGGLFVLSMYTAFLYYNRLTFYLGYIFLFLGFTMSIFASYWYVNSGYQAFMNVVYEKYSDYFKLLNLREATEYISNRQLTISVTMIFVGFFLSILLNITISGYMNLIETFLITFPLLQVALYIDAKPALPYLAMLLSVYITVGILGRSGHYQVSSIRQSQKSFYHKRRKHMQVHSYVSDGRSMLTTGIYSILLCSVFLLITFGLFYSDLGSSLTRNKLKTTTDEYVKTFVQTGIYGLFDRYSSTGGLNQGQLGGVGSVRPDYETDLSITFVPYTTESIYLKAFVGSYYDYNQFSPLYNDPRIKAGILSTVSKKDSTDLVNMTENQLYPGFAERLHGLNRYAKMQITYVGTDSSAIYMPYDSFQYSCDSNTAYSESYQKTYSADSDLSTDAIEAFDARSSVLTDLEEDTNEDTNEDTYTILYEPYESQISYAADNDISPEYEEFIYDTYLQIPTYLEETLKDFDEEAGLTARMEEVSSAADDDSSTQAARLVVAGALKGYFAKNFEYTLMPGTTPRNQDVIAYFLTSQKRGYCAHFASSATMILRSLGIPARYVEGYCVPLSSVNEGDAVSLDTEQWFVGNNSLSETAVVNVDITDAQAHAWVEIYLDGYGWIPYEFTPPSDDEEVITNLDFMSIFSGLFMTSQQETAGSTSDGDDTLETLSSLSNFHFNFAQSFGFILWPLVILLTLTAIGFSVFYLRNDIRLHFQLKNAQRKGQYNKAIELQYRRLYQTIQKTYQKACRHGIPEGCPDFIHSNIAPREVFTWLGENKDILLISDKYVLSEILTILQKACFSEEESTLKEYEMFQNFVKECRNEIKKGKLKKEN